MIDRMPFGKFKGTRLTELDDQYVLWVLTLPDLRDPLREAVERESDRRQALTRRRELHAWLEQALNALPVILLRG